jgi:hypothetical protein
MKKIGSVSDEIVKLKREAELLIESLEERQDRLIVRMKDIISEELVSLMN